MMKIALLVVGIVVALLGGLGYYVASANWKVWLLFWKFTVPNPFSFLVIPTLILTGIGIVVFLAGLFWDRR